MAQYTVIRSACRFKIDVCIPEGVLAEVSAELPVRTLDQVEVDSGLLRQAVVDQHEQPERAE